MSAGHITPERAGGFTPSPTSTRDAGDSRHTVLSVSLGREGESLVAGEPKTVPEPLRPVLVFRLLDRSRLFKDCDTSSSFSALSLSARSCSAIAACMFSGLSGREPRRTTTPGSSERIIAALFGGFDAGGLDDLAHAPDVAGAADEASG